MALPLSLLGDPSSDSRLFEPHSFYSVRVVDYSTAPIFQASYADAFHMGRHHQRSDIWDEHHSDRACVRETARRAAAPNLFSRVVSRRTLISNLQDCSAG